MPIAMNPDSKAGINGLGFKSKDGLVIVNGIKS